VARDNCCCLTITQDVPAGTEVNPGTFFIRTTVADAVGNSITVTTTLEVLIGPPLRVTGGPVGAPLMFTYDSVAGQMYRLVRHLSGHAALD
jgi:hypothetical protein